MDIEKFREYLKSLKPDELLSFTNEAMPLFEKFSKNLQINSNDKKRKKKKNYTDVEIENNFFKRYSQ